MSPAIIDCNLPSPHIGEISWRPGGCNSTTALILVIEAITTYLCDNIAPATETGNNNLRIVPGGTSSGDFNAEFYLSTPADDAIVLEGMNIWWSVDNGTNWDILEINTFQVGNAGDFADPDNPTPAELRALFPQSLPASNALVYSTHNKFLYETQDSGVGWAAVHYVDAEGDTMTGLLTINISEIDAASTVINMQLNSTHTITADNGNDDIAVIAAASFDADVFNGGGAIAFQSNTAVEAAALGTLTYAKGFEASIVKNGVGDLTDGIAFHALAFSNNAGTVDNFYGLKVEDVAGASVNYAIHTSDGLVVFNEDGNASSDVRIEGDADANLLFTDASTNRVGIGIAAPIGKAHIQQESTTAAIPVITIQQKDISEEFVRIIGESDAVDNSKSIIDAAALPTPGAIAGWYKVYVQDDANNITDSYYWVPFYDSPTV